MHKVIKKQYLNEEICLVQFEALDLAKAAMPGQFVVLRVDETGERFPLTLYDWDTGRGTVTVVCQAIGVSTKKLCALKIGDSILDAAGPLGHATNTRNIGKVICIGGGVGTAEVYPIARAFQKDGNSVSVIIGARSKNLIICEKEIRQFCNNVYIATDDGTHGQKGFVTDILCDLLEKDTPDLVFAVGPAMMMKMVAKMTQEKNIKTLTSLNSIMIDGTGMCGSCRVLYDGKVKFACVDGPEFDAHKIDFEDLMQRGSRYVDKEKTALEHYEKCHIGLKH